MKEPPLVFYLFIYSIIMHERLCVKSKFAISPIFLLLTKLKYTIYNILLYSTTRESIRFMKKHNFIAILLLVTLNIQTCTLSGLAINSSTFSDASSIASWAKNDVDEAYDLGFVQGYNGAFHPDAPITRSAFTKLLVTMLGLTPEKHYESIFSDVSKQDWFTPYVLTAYEYGLITGSGGAFHPNNNITREEMAVIIARAFPLSQSSHMSFSDRFTISSWATDSVASVYHNGIITGYDGKFHPKDTATRQMATVILMRAYRQKLAFQSAVSSAICQTGQHLLSASPTPNTGTVGGEWLIFGLARSNVAMPKTYADSYISKAETYIVSEHNKPTRKFGHKVTDTQRLAITLASLGADIENVNGIDLVDYTWNKETYMSDLIESQRELGGRQGLNELCFGLLTIDLLPSYTPSGAQITRQEIIKTILQDYQLSSGGFSLSKDNKTFDLDITAMTITALAPYYNRASYDNVTKAIDKALTVISSKQNDDGGFGNPSNVESTAQVVVALCSLGIDPTIDTRFKQDTNLISHVLSFQDQNDSFSHTLNGATSQMATEQAFYALVSYERLITNQVPLYDMSDVN